MAHKQQQEFVSNIKQHFPEFFTGKKILEIGSLDINGSVRNEFAACDYTGLDVAPGPGVDVVCEGQVFDAPDSSFDVAISCEVMEHNPSWKETFENMARLTKPGGLVVMTCASTGRPEHGTARTTPAYSPLTVELGWNYYRNLTAKDFYKFVKISSLFSEFSFFSENSSCDLYFVGFKVGAPPPPSAHAALKRMSWKYALRNSKNLLKLKQRLLIALVGEERYFAGPVRLWKRHNGNAV